MAMRVNYMIHPYPTSGTFAHWNTRGYGGGAGNYALVTSGGPFGTAYARKTWTTGTATPSSTGFEILGGPSTGGRYPSGSGIIQYLSGYMRSSVAAVVYARMVWTNGAGSTISITDGNPVTLVPNAWTRVEVMDTAPVGTDTYRVLFDVHTTNPAWAVGNTLELTDVMVERAPTLGTYFNGDDSFAVWTGTAADSYSNLYVPEISLVQMDDYNPVPRCEVFLVDVPPGYSTIRRTADGRTLDVRGSVRRPFAAGITILDTEVPFGVPATYQAELYDANGDTIGFTTTATTTMPTTTICLHQPMDPTLGTLLEMDADSLKVLKRGFTSSETVYTDGASVGRWIGGRRRGLTGVKMRLEATSENAANTVQEMFGGYNEDQVPVLCLRTPPGYGRIPRVLFLAIPDPGEEDVSVRYGGGLVDFDIEGDEVAPPFPGLAASLLGYDDTDAFFGTYSAIDTEYGTYLARDRDYSKAGYV